MFWFCLFFLFTLYIHYWNSEVDDTTIIGSIVNKDYSLDLSLLRQKAALSVVAC